MQVAMWVRWSRPVAGRERRALEYGVEVQDFWGKRAVEGKCTSPEMFTARSGGGMWMVKGESDSLAELVQSEASQRLLAGGTRFGAVGAELGYL